MAGLTEEEKAKKAAEAKAAKEKKEAEAKAAAKKAADEAAAKVDAGIKSYKAVKGRMYHPLKKMYFYPDRPVDCVPDGWVTDQVNAGLLSEAE